MLMEKLESSDQDSIQAALAQFLDLGGPEFVAEMVEILNSQTPAQFAEIDAALAGGDISAAQRHAHSMKSSFGNFGAQNCQRLATEMDRAGKAGDVAAYRAAYDALKPEFARLKTILG